MPNPTFVLMYHPALGNARALVSFSSIDDHAGKGWLLVDGVTPAPSSPYLTPAVGDARYPVLSGGKVQDAQLPTRLGDVALRAASVAAAKDAGFAKADELAAVATSGSYGDLVGLPQIPNSADDIGAQPAGNYVTAEQLAGVTPYDGGMVA